MKILKIIEDGDYKVTQYTKDGVSVYSELRVLKSTAEHIEIEPQPSIEEKILVETQYQTVLLEMNMMF